MMNRENRDQVNPPAEQEPGNQSAPEEAIAALRRELEEEKNRHLRTRADFDNYRRRSERANEKARLQAGKDILEDLLVFLEYFAQAGLQIRDPAAARGIEIMERQFKELLQRHGVRAIDCLGKPFDPEEQEGMGYRETGECPEGYVAEEICPGYKLGDLLLRPARVLVAKKPSGD